MSGVRSLAFGAWFFGMTFVLALGTLPLRLFAPSRALAYGRFWARLAIVGLRRLCGVTIDVTGLHHIPRGPALLASMHQSAFDTLIWMLLVPNAAYVYKRELRYLPLFGAMLRLAGMIELDRRARPAAVRDFLRAAERAKAEGRQIVIFPEGTRVAPGVRVPLLPGVAALAARTGLPVIPVATDSGLCWGRRAWRKRAGVIHIAIQPALPPGLPREALLERLRAAWDAGCAGFGQSVDNSVNEASGSFPSRARWEPQSFE